MEIAFGIVTILQNIAVCLGVGSSTFALSNFFVAIWDGNIDATERKMMGVVYVVLRISMIAILLTTLVQGWIVYDFVGWQYFIPLTVLTWTIIAMLFLNAALMTAHAMPMTVGAGLQAGSWYTLGIITAMTSVGWVQFTLWQYFGGYFILVLLFILAVNLLLKYQKDRLSKSTSK